MFMSSTSGACRLSGLGIPTSTESYACEVLKESIGQRLGGPACHSLLILYHVAVEPEQIGEGRRPNRHWHGDPGPGRPGGPGPGPAAPKSRQGFLELTTSVTVTVTTTIGTAGFTSTSGSCRHRRFRGGARDRRFSSTRMTEFKNKPRGGTVVGTRFGRIAL